MSNEISRIGAVERKIDELGRLLLPKELMKRLNWDSGDSVVISADSENETLALTLLEKAGSPKCVFCTSHLNTMKFKNRDICDSCLAKINQKNAMLG